MSAEKNAVVPVWTLATEEADIPKVFHDEGMTPARLAELRTVLATLANTPIATLEAHPISTKRDRSSGIALNAASPLAKELSQLVNQTMRSGHQAAAVATTGEVLYRMVVPAKVAAQVGNGLVRPMASKAVTDGVHGALVNAQGIAAQAAFVPVAGKAAGAVGAKGGVGIATGTAGALTVAAPLVLMAVAVGVSAYVDNQRQKSIERITDLLEKLHEDKLEKERSELDGCRDAIDKATAVLFDNSRIGHSLGLDSAAFAIATATERAKRRLARWQKGLDNLPTSRVEPAQLTKTFPGIDREGGEFRAHLEMARLAIALKRRVLVLQAVEHAQLEGANHPFKSFLRSLHKDERRIDELETGIDSVLHRLSTLELKRYGGFRSIYFSQGEVEDLLKAAYLLRAFGDELPSQRSQPDVAIEIEQRVDGSVVVYPAAAV